MRFVERIELTKHWYKITTKMIAIISAEASISFWIFALLNSIIAIGSFHIKSTRNLVCSCVMSSYDEGPYLIIMASFSISLIEHGVNSNYSHSVRVTYLKFYHVHSTVSKFVKVMSTSAPSLISNGMQSAILTVGSDSGSVLINPKKIPAKIQIVTVVFKNMRKESKRMPH